MSPYFTIANIGNQRLADAEYPGDLSLRSWAGPYLADLIVSELCVFFLRAKRNAVSSFRFLVLHIVSVVSKKKMAGINAWRVVAFMKDLLAKRYCAICKYVRRPVSADCIHCFWQPDNAIAVIVSPGNPGPAGAEIFSYKWAIAVNLWPKSFREWFCGSAHGGCDNTE